MTFDATLERIKKSTGARTQVELAAILNIRQSSISDAKRRNSVPADWYLKLYRSHGLNPDWLADGMDPMYLKPGMAEAHGTGVQEAQASYGKSPSRARVVSVSSMTGGQAEEGCWKPEYMSQIALPETFHKPTVMVVQVDGAGMEPIVRRGAYVGIDTEQKRVLSGEIYGLHVPPEGLVLKRVFFDANKGHYVLRSENPAHPEQVLPQEKMDSLVVGRMVWVLQEV